MHIYVLFSCSRHLGSASFLCRRHVSSQHNLIQSLLSMPREPKDNQELKKIRMKIKEKGLKYVPGTVSLQVLGSGAFGAPKSLYVFTDQTRYLFNVGEGSQRLAHEHKMKLSKLEQIFITRPTWENIGGLPGVALTIQDVGVPEITLHGPAGTNDIFPATRRFVVLKDLSVRMATCTPEASFEDNVMAVKYVPITAVTNHNAGSEAPHDAVCSLDEADDVDYYCHERRTNGSAPRQAVGRHSPLPAVTERISPVVMCYVCKLKTRPGTLNLEACVERGVTPGPLLGRLKNGEDVTLLDGSIVRSVDVTTPDEPGPLFIVVDCPSEEFLAPLVNDPAFNMNQSNSPDEDLKAYSIIHFTPREIVQTQEYQHWMTKFPASTTHLVLNGDNTCTGSVAVHRIQYMLNMLHPGIFPLLKTPVGSPECPDGNVQNVGTMTTVHLRPKKGLDLSQTLELTPEAYVNEPFNTEEFQQELAKYLQDVQNFTSGPEEYPKIVFLGTGSCIPNKTRNTSGILIHTSKEDCVLLDCGEATFNQILRLHGVDAAKEIMSKLRMVYISHLHADHHIGLVGLLKGRRQLLGSEAKPVFLLAPKQIMYWLNFYHARFEHVLSEFHLVTNGDLSGGNGRTISQEVEEMIETLNCRDVATVFVRHCPNAFGIAISHKAGWKLTYSGDTMPCQDLVALGLDSDILIHEATMEDELEQEAKMKLHSTTSQAVNVGQAMRAKFTILTHFSQRYAKLPRLKQSFSDNVGIAFDNMQVSMNELPLLPKMYPVLKMMFADHCDEMDAKAARRTLRKEMKRAASLSPTRGGKVHHAES